MDLSVKKKEMSAMYCEKENHKHNEYNNVIQINKLNKYFQNLKGEEKYSSKINKFLACIALFGGGP